MHSPWTKTNAFRDTTCGCVNEAKISIANRAYVDNIGNSQPTFTVTITNGSEHLKARVVHASCATAMAIPVI